MIFWNDNKNEKEGSIRRQIGSDICIQYICIVSFKEDHPPLGLWYSCDFKKKIWEILRMHHDIFDYIVWIWDTCFAFYITYQHIKVFPSFLGHLYISSFPRRAQTISLCWMFISPSHIISTARQSHVSLYFPRQQQLPSTSRCQNALHYHYYYYFIHNKNHDMLVRCQLFHNLVTAKLERLYDVKLSLMK